MENVEDELKISHYGLGDGSLNLRECSLVNKDLERSAGNRKIIRHCRSFGFNCDFSTGTLLSESGYSNSPRQSSHPVSSDKFSYRHYSDDKFESRFESDKRFSGGTKSKLLILNEKLQGFEKQMEREARQRRLLEESRFLSINESLDKLQNSISQESKRRMETIKALHGIFESQILSVENKVESIFSEKLDQLEGVVQSLCNRLNEIQQRSEENDKRFREHIEKNCITIEKNLATVQKLFESEKLARQEREEHIMKKLTELELKSETYFGSEMENIESAYQELKTELESLKKTKEEREKSLKSSILDEIANINNGLILESRARENADDDIVQALHSYAKVLADYSRLQTIT